MDIWGMKRGRIGAPGQIKIKKGLSAKPRGEGAALYLYISNGPRVNM